MERPGKTTHVDTNAHKNTRKRRTKVRKLWIEEGQGSQERESGVPPLVLGSRRLSTRNARGGEKVLGPRGARAGLARVDNASIGQLEHALSGGQAWGVIDLADPSVVAACFCWFVVIVMTCALLGAVESVKGGVVLVCSPHLSLGRVGSWWSGP